MTKKNKTKMPKIGSKFVKSRFEWEMYNKLKDALPKGATIEYEADKLPYVIEHMYTPDFTITLRDGRKFYIETKGNGRQFAGDVRQKMVAVRDQNPDADIRFIFYADGRIGGSQKRKSGDYYRQSDWSNKNNFLFTIREIDEAWFL